MFTYLAYMKLSRSMGTLTGQNMFYPFRLSTKTIKNPEDMMIPEVYYNPETHNHFLACYISGVPRITKIPDKYVPSVLDSLELFENGVQTAKDIESLAKISEL